MNVKVVIIDDEKSAIQSLEELCNTYMPEVKVVGRAQTIEESIAVLNNAKPDALFLDIELGDTKGFDLLDVIDASKYQIIFVTAFEQHAVKAFKYNAVDYVMKPIVVKDLVRATGKVKEKLIEKAKKKANTKDSYSDLLNRKVGIPTFKGMKYTELVEIIRIEADGSYSNVILKSEDNLVVTKPLRFFELLLDARLFVRIHRSHIINTHYVSEFRRDQGGILILDNEDRIPVSENKRDLIRKRVIF